MLHSFVCNIQVSLAFFIFLFFYMTYNLFGFDKKAFGEEEETKKIKSKRKHFYKESNMTFLEYVSIIHY